VAPEHFNGEKGLTVTGSKSAAWLQYFDKQTAFFTVQTGERFLMERKGMVSFSVNYLFIGYVELNPSRWMETPEEVFGGKLCQKGRSRSH
jgi:hypothetical protein